MQTWHDVSRSNPCPICGKPDWCCVSMDGAWAICRRVDTGVGRHRQDKSGADFWLYRLDGGSLQQRPAVEVPPPSSRCADTDTLDRIYNGLLNALPLSPAHRQALRQRAVELCQRLIALQIPYQGLNAGHEPRQMLHRAQGRGQERLRAQGIDIRLKDHLTDGRQALV